MNVIEFSEKLDFQHLVDYLSFYKEILDNGESVEIKLNVIFMGLLL